MSTTITVSTGASSLVARSKQVQQDNRAGLLQLAKDSALQARLTFNQAQQGSNSLRPLGGNPDTSIDRKPAAFRNDPNLEVFHLLVGYGRWSIFDYPNLDPGNSISLDPPTPSYSGLHWGLQIYPIYRSNPNQPDLTLYAFEPPLQWTLNYEVRGIERLNTFLLPIDGKRAVYVMYWQWRHAWVPEGTLQDIHTTHLKCALVTSTSARELTPPSRLRAELERLYPQLPAPDKLLSMNIYDANGNYVESKSGLWDWNGRTSGEWDPINHRAHKVVTAFGVGDYSEEGHRLDYGFDFQLPEELRTDGCFFSPGVYELLLNPQVSVWCQQHPSDADDYAQVRTQFIDPLGSKFDDAKFCDVFWQFRTSPGSVTFNSTRRSTKNSATPADRKVAMPENSSGLGAWKQNKDDNIKENVTWPERDLANDYWTYPQTFYAANWDNPAYCLGKLRQLGFSDSDLVP